MALSTEEAQELKSAFSLMSADELRGMKGDDADHDALIDQMLDTGKAVEVKGGAVADDKPAPAADTEGDEDDEDDGETGFVDEHGRPVADPNAAPAADEAPAAAAEPELETPAPAPAAGDIAPLDLGFLDAQFKDKLGALTAQNSADFKAMMDGTMDAEEYAAKNAAYLDQRDSLRDEKQVHAAYWSTVHAFKVGALDDGINYDTDAEKGAALDDWVKRIANNPANKLSDAAILQAAHKKVMIEFEVAPRAASAPAPQNSPKTPVAEKKVANKQGRAPDLSAIPPTIGTLPSATSIDGGDGGEFAHLDKLSGMDFERALAELYRDPAKKARYEAM